MEHVSAALETLCPGTNVCREIQKDFASESGLMSCCDGMQ